MSGMLSKAGSAGGGLGKRLLQLLALYAPGAKTVRVTLHRWRGVTIGPGTFIGTAAILETERPELIYIGRDVTIGVRATVIAHFRGNSLAERGRARYSVRIEDEAFVGPGVIILNGVTVGRGAVITAGSVVSASVAPMTMVQGNPARPVAKLEQPLLMSTDYGKFLRGMKRV
jgi:acetyltransferase-like isoleucine patch superfamily enzyme